MLSDKEGGTRQRRVQWLAPKVPGGAPFTLRPELLPHRPLVLATQGAGNLLAVAQEWMSTQDIENVRQKILEIAEIRGRIRALGDMPSLESAFSAGQDDPAAVLQALATMRTYVQEGLRFTERMDQLLGDIITICAAYATPGCP